MDAISLDGEEILVNVGGVRPRDGDVVIPIQRSHQGKWIGALLVFKNAFVQEKWCAPMYEGDLLPCTVKFGENSTLIGQHDAFLVDIHYAVLDVECSDQ